MDKSDLKALLKEIKAKDYIVPENANAFQMAKEMMAYMGDVDGEMRNDLAFDILVEWIMVDALTPEQAQEILITALDESHLHRGLGSKDDTVFDRSFSVEVAACILHKHRSFLGKDLVLTAFDKVTHFYKHDVDVRGYVEGKSWAHGAAHGADALAELVEYDFVGYDKMKEILDLVYNKININYYSYVNNEDERIICVVEGILERNIVPVTEIEDWIKRFGDLDKRRTGIQPDDFHLEFNVTLFLKSLCFRLMEGDKYPELAKLTKGVLRNVSRFYEN